MRRIFDWKRERFPALPRGQRPESTRYLANPGQGWYRIYTYDAGLPFDPAGGAFPEEEPLALVRISLVRWRERPLPESCLSNIQEILRFFDARGTDLLLRIAYDFDGRGLESEPDLFSLVEGHLRQLAPIVHQFGRRILVFQGLLVGSWGEMHQSKFLAPQRLRALEAALRSGGNQDVCLAVRRPCHLRMLAGPGARADGRRTWFNDGLCGSETDLGTFGWKPRHGAGWEEPWAREDELAFLETFCADVPFGGEAVLPEAGADMPPEETVRHLERVRLSYLNCQHDARLLAGWKRQAVRHAAGWDGVSLYDYIGAHMGCRFCLRRAAKRESGGETLLSAEIENTGFGNLCQQALAEVACVDGTGALHCQPLPWDAREWRCGSRTVCTARLRLPPGRLYLRLRRQWDGRPILFANDGIGLPVGGGDCGEFVSLC